MSITRKVIAAAIVLATTVGARALAAPPDLPPAPPVPSPTVPAVPTTLPTTLPTTIPTGVPTVAPPAVPAPNPGGPCQLNGDAGDRADAASPLPFLLDNKDAAYCTGDFAPANVDTADWYWFDVRPTTAALTVIVQPTFGNAAFSAPLPSGDDVDARLVGPNGQILPVLAGGRGQPHTFVIPQPAPGLYKLAVLPGPSTPTANYTVVATLTGP